MKFSSSNYEITRLEVYRVEASRVEVSRVVTLIATVALRALAALSLLTSLSTTDVFAANAELPENSKVARESEVSTKEKSPTATDKNAAKRIVENPLQKISIFDKYNRQYATDFFPTEVEKVEEVPNTEATDRALAEKESGKQQAKTEATHQEFDARGSGAKAPAAAQADARAALVTKTVAEPNGPTFVGNFKPEDALPPEADYKVRVNPDAPTPFILMTQAQMSGDRETAAKYADQWVRYQQNFFYEVRELTGLIGEALIRNKQIEEEDWYGVPQLIDYELAKTRRETGALFKPSHEQSMKQIAPDANGEAAVYYFFSLNCSYCRTMAPDVERLFQAVKGDVKVKMVALSIGDMRPEFLQEYRNYTGMTLPILEGSKVAQQFNVAYPPALVVVSPTAKKAYVKTGAQSFERMYEFVRTVQGLPPTLTPEIQKIATTKIGAIENAAINLGREYEKWVREDDVKFVKARMASRASGMNKTLAAQVGQKQKVNVKELKF